jgi:5-formyltetrahydrofolate cyclo-ligase
MDKAALRRKILRKLKSQSQEEKERRNAYIREKFFSLPEFKIVQWIMFYISLSYEVDTKEMVKEALEMGKKVAIPVIIPEQKRMYASQVINPDDELTEGPYGIYQPKSEYLRPVAADKIDLVVVPAIAFDKSGNRLGHGQGYYDRFLHQLPKKTAIIGLAYQFQIVEDLPHTHQDIPVSKIIFS